MYRGALRSIFSELVRQERLLCIDKLNISSAKTKAALEALAALGLDEVLIITDTISDALHLSTRNLARVAVVNTHEIDPYSLVGFDRVLITRTALEQVEQWLGSGDGDSATPAPAGADETAEPVAADGGEENE